MVQRRVRFVLACALLVLPLLVSAQSSDPTCQVRGTNGQLVNVGKPCAKTKGICDAKGACGLKEASEEEKKKLEELTEASRKQSELSPYPVSSPELNAPEAPLPPIPTMPHQFTLDRMLPGVSNLIQQNAAGDPGGQQIWRDSGCVIVSCEGEPPLQPLQDRFVSFPNDPSSIQNITNDINARLSANPDALAPSPAQVGKMPYSDQGAFNSYDDTADVRVLHAYRGPEIEGFLKTPSHDLSGDIFGDDPVPMLKIIPPNKFLEDQAAPFPGTSGKFGLPDAFKQLDPNQDLSPFSSETFGPYEPIKQEISPTLFKNIQTAVDRAQELFSTTWKWLFSL